ncbi:MAG TPA: CCA tRNA nucleotidyltransferase [Tepidisphaeraceae bacterium]|jgi:poly(A) polymerase|nr:CCA tRNA nucleotidyltransferase [Tepidisphaeraceae bacterium]
MDDKRNKPRCDRADATAVLRRLRENGHEAYFAGGCVRDLLLGLEPKDYDVATDAPPQRVRDLFTHTQAVGAAFGVILVRHGKSVVEVATFRSDGSYLDGRRPSEVRFTTAQEDAQRRDFTINGLFFDPLDGDRVIDYVGGREDLESRRLRAIGDAGARFAEDHLRLLRAVRFAARFGLEIALLTASAIEARAGLLKGISPERIADELRLMLSPPTRSAAWLLLWKFKLIHVVMRFLPLGEDVRLNPSKSVFLATAPGAEISFGLALAAAVLDVELHGGADVINVVARKNVNRIAKGVDKALKLSNVEFEEMEQALGGVAMVLGETPTVAVLKRFLARATSGGSRHLLDALEGIGVYEEKIGTLKKRIDELQGVNVAPEALITGDDLSARGLVPGPMFKRILEGAYDAQLEGRVKTKEEAMEMAMKIASTRPGSG